MVALSAALSSPQAHAAAGDHVQVGQGELEPSVSAQTAWSSNVYLKEADEVSALAVVLRPAFKLRIDGTNTRVDLDGSWGLRQYLTAGRQNLSSYGETKLAGGVVLLPRSRISVKTAVNHSRSTRAVEGIGTDESLITSLLNRGSAALSFQPGSALSFSVGGFGSYDDFKVPSYATLKPNGSLNNRLGYGPEAALKWTFFPRTAVLGSFSKSWYDWDDNAVGAVGDDGQYTDDIGDVLAMPNSEAWRAMLGLHGRITERLVLSLSGGYGEAIYDEETVDESANEGAGEDYSQDLEGFPNGLVIRTGLQWSPRRGHTLDLGYWKDHQDSWFTNYVSYKYGYLRYDGMMTSRVLMGLEGGYRLETFHGEVTRADHVIRGEGYLTVRTSGWADLSLRGFWTRRASANTDVDESIYGPNLAWIEYDNYGATVDLTLRY